MPNGFSSTSLARSFRSNFPSMRTIGSVADGGTAMYSSRSVSGPISFSAAWTSLASSAASSSEATTKLTRATNRCHASWSISPRNISTA